jgi:hypothetical protein
MLHQLSFRPLIIATFLFFAFSCQGPKGDPGLTGKDGSQGPQGQVGPAGAVPIIINDTILKAEWISPGIGRFMKSINVPQINNQFFSSSGAVIVYIGAGPTIDTIRFWHALPFINDYDHPNGDRIFTHLSYSFGPNVVGLSYTYLKNGKHDPQRVTYPIDIVIRIVLLPGQIANGRLPSVDYSNYDEVKKAYNLPD